MSAEATGAADRLGLWSDRRFRVLTLLNASLVVVSAAVALWSAFSEQGSAMSWLVLLFPVVPVTIAYPPISLMIIASAAAFSLLCLFHDDQRGVRFVRAMTVWGTLALTIPSVLVAVLWGPAMVGALR